MPPISLRRMLPSDRDAVLQLQVHETQSAFVDPIAEVLAAHVGTWDDHVVLSGAEVVGFFQIDAQEVGPRIVDQIEFHEVRIDAQHQGKGYGKSFLEVLRDYLSAEYPEASDVCLTVNFRNLSAYAVYQHGGFIDTGGVYPDGGAGPQHIMTMPLRLGERTEDNS